MKICFIDFDLLIKPNGFKDTNSPIGVSIIEIGTSQKKFHSLINPERKKLRLSEQTENTLNITTDTLKNSPTFKEVYAQVNEFIKGSSKVYAWGQEGLRAWNVACMNHGIEETFQVDDLQSLYREEFSLVTYFDLAECRDILQIADTKVRNKSETRVELIRGIHMMLLIKPAFVKRELRKQDCLIGIKKLKHSYPDVFYSMEDVLKSKISI